MTDPLEREKAYLKTNLAELAKQYPGKYLLIKGGTVHGAYETFDEGVSAGVEQLGKGPFLVRSVEKPDDDELPDIPALTVGVLHSANPQPTI